jgi:purine-binding chemotaxis protein CheW
MVGGSGLQILMFEAGGVGCGLRRGDVRELLPLPRLWRPPGAPKPLAGFFNLGGQAVAAVDLAILLGIEGRSNGAGAQFSAEAQVYRHLMLVDRLGGSGPAALLVDRVLDLVAVEPGQLSPVRATETLNGCVEAEIDRGGALVHLLSLERLLLTEEAQSLAELRRSAQDRLGEWALGA